MTPERGGDGRDYEGRLSDGKAEERGGAAFQDIGVRTSRVPGECIEGRKNGNAACGKHRSKEAKSLREGLRLFVGCDEKERRAAKFSRKISGEQRFSGGLQAGKMNFRFAGPQSAERAFDRRKAQQAFEAFANYGKNHRMAL